MKGSAGWFVAAVLVVPRAANACGSSGPDGVSACSLAEYAEEQRPRWRVGVSGVYTSTVIAFSGFRAGETRYAAAAEIGYAPTARLSFTGGFGGAFGGSLLAPDGRHDVTPGILVDAGVSFRAIDGDTAVGRGFVLVSGVVSYTGASTQLGDTGPLTAYNALDFRGGVAGGFTWFHFLSGYLVARVFGGPAFWKYQGTSELGTDTHHYQVGGGLAVAIVKRVDLFVEGVPLGEQALATGMSVVF